jgi:threonine dehydrogenase-like Zn-dependent dehydrogenase
VIHNAKTMNAELGSSVAVIGCGLGIIHGALAILRGCAPVIVIGDNERKLAVAKSMGVDFTINVKECSDVVGEVRKLTKGRGPDYVVEAVGSAKTYELAFEMVRSGGLVSAFGITGGDDILPLHPAELVLHEKKIAGSCAGSGNDWTEAITLVEHGRIVPKRMFSMLVPLEELEAAMKELRSNPDLIKVLVSAEVSKRQIL